ncbi:RHS repeat-associated core domain-containing protein [Marinicauda pacifica]|uniref:RHS repeat-associated core domain-containing protein n=1 Tax=Marinicauda pacifica TaxID=1133559 RepID=UPI0035C7EE34
MLETGAKLLFQNDFATHDGLFSISRFYRSFPAGRSLAFRSTARGLASGWAFNFAYELQFNEFSGSPSNPDAQVAFVTPDGVAYDFVLAPDGSWMPWSGAGLSYEPADITVELLGGLPSDLSDLMDSPSTWQIVDEQDRTITFIAQPYPNTNDYRIARPTSIEYRGGYTWTFSYGSDHALSEIVDSFGRQAQFTWHYRHITSLSGQPGGAPHPEAIDEITFPDGSSARYIYDPTPNGVAAAAPTPLIERLIGVEWLNPSGETVDSTTLHYEDPRFGWHITGVTDHRNERVSNYTYNDHGRVATTSGAAGSELYTIEYLTTSSGVERRVVNPLGRAAVYTFDRFGNRPIDLRFTEMDGEPSANCPASASSVAYDSSGFVSSYVDEEGRATQFTRDARGLTTQLVEASGSQNARATEYSWHSSLNVPVSVETQELRREFDYDTAGRLIRTRLVDQTNHLSPYPTYGRVREWAYSYTSEGLVSTIDGPLPGLVDQVEYTYDSNGYISTYTNSLGHLTRVTSTDARGGPTTIEDPNGVETRFTYDALGRATGITVNPGPNQSDYGMTYTPAGDLFRLSLPEGAYLEHSYDADRRLTLVANDRGETVSYSYNAADAITSVVVESETSSVLFEQTYAYDELARVIALVGADAQSTGFGYDKVSNLVALDDARSQTYSFSFDALNRLISQTDPEANSFVLGYNNANQLVTHEDPRALVTTRVVDGFGFVIQENSPDRGAWSYWYDNAGRLTKLWDGANAERIFTYDAAGRRVSMSFSSAPAEDVNYTYDSTANGNYGVGRLTRVDDQTGHTEFTYDAQGRVTERVKSIGSNVYATGYQYDRNGEVTRLSLPSGRQIYYERASDGRIISVRMGDSAEATSSSLVSNVVWEPARGLAEMDIANGLSLERRYDADGWLNDNIVTGLSGAIVDVSYSRDGTGALTYQNDYSPDSPRTAGFGYTASGRLDWANGPWGELSYSYDSNGNRTETRIVSGGGVSAYEFVIVDSANNRVDEVRDTNWNLQREFFYGLNGELVREDRGQDTYAYFYNTSGRLVHVTLNGTTVGQYGYDAFGHRVWRDVDGGSTASLDYVFDGAGYLMSVNDANTGSPIREFIWLNDILIAFVDHSPGTPKLFFVHTGQVNEVLAITDATGGVVLQSYLRPYGLQEVIPGIAASIDLRLPGQWVQSETGGLFQNWHRDYDPALGRYIQPDPIGLAAGPNVYTYVDANPLNAIDPTGLQTVVPEFQVPPGTPISPYLEPYVPYNQLPLSARQVLSSRFLVRDDQTGELWLGFDIQTWNKGPTFPRRGFLARFFPNGTVYCPVGVPLPPPYSERNPSPGFRYTPHGLDPRSPFPNIKAYNDNGQAISPVTGRTISPRSPEAHYPTVYHPSVGN